MKYFIIFNPGARDGRSKKNLNRIKEYFAAHNLDHDLVTTEKLDDAYRFSVKANKKGYDIIIAAGGDGTINRTLNGFYDESGKRISNAGLGIIYSGTSPDFCKSYNIPFKDLKHSLQTIKRGKRIKIQVGKIIHAKQFIPGIKKVIKNDANFTTGYFGCCANIGLGATLARLANSGIRKLFGDALGTFISLIKTLSIYRARDITCNFNGIKQHISNVYNISIGKTYYIASGIKVNNTLEQGDGLFYSLLVKDLSLYSILSCMKTIYSGDKIVNSNTVTLSYNSVFEIESGEYPVEVEFDGDPMGFLPCRIEMAEETLDLIVENCNG